MSTEQVLKHYENLPENRVFAALSLADRLLGDGNITNSHANLVDGFSLLSCFLETIGLSGLSKQALATQNVSLQDRDGALRALSQLRNLVGKEMQNRTMEYGFRQFGHLFEGTITYVFEEEELKSIQTTINQLRQLITDAKCIEDRHKKRLLLKLESLQKELHVKMTSLEKFWDLAIDAWGLVAKHGPELKQFAERVMEIANKALEKKMIAEEINLHLQLGIGKNQFQLGVGNPPVEPEKED